MDYSRNSYTDYLSNKGTLATYSLLIHHIRDTANNYN